jgi:PAS domain S-box-containing protein
MPYVVSLAVVALALLIRQLLWPVLGDAVPYMIVFPATVAAAWYGGAGPGFLSAIAGGTFTYVWLIDHGADLAKSGQDTAAYALFLSVDALIIAVVAKLREARNRAEAARLALEESEERLRLSTGAAQMGTWTRDLRTEVVTWSAELARVFGIEPEDFGGLEQNFFQFVHPDDLPRVIRVVREATELRSDYEIDFRFIRADGQIRWMLARGKVYCDAAGTPVRLAGIGLDVTERKAAGDALRASEERYRSLVAATSSVVWTADPSGSFVEPQPAWEAFTGQSWKEHHGWRWIAAIHPDDRENLRQRWRRALAEKTAYEAEGRVWRSAIQQYREVVARGVPVLNADGSVREWIGTLTDIHEKKRLDEKLLHADKLESLGVLAGGIAHDFNNLLVGIMGNASLLEETASPHTQQAELASAIVQASERAAHLTRQMLAYAGKGQFIIRDVDLSREIRDLLPLIEPAVPKRVEVRLSLDGELPRVPADPSQIQQVVMNLVINAAEATPAGGTIHISTGVHEQNAGSSEFAGGEALSAGRYVFLRVEDTGQGMDETTRRKIFDPFFTTKFTGRGLGLAAVLGIVRAHRGAVHVASEPGRGAAFTVYFPPAKSAEAAPRAHFERSAH